MQKQDNVFWIYMIECNNGRYYTGYTNDLEKRYAQHINGKSGAKYTKSFKPVRIAQCWRLYDTRSIAMKVEAFIKTKPKKFKKELIDQPDLLRLAIIEKFDLRLQIITPREKKIKKLMQKQ